MLASSTPTKTFGLAEELFLLMHEILHDPGNSYDLRVQAPRQGFEYLTASLFRSVDILRSLDPHYLGTWASAYYTYSRVRVSRDVKDGHWIRDSGFLIGKR